jgi:hypothetical protein
MSNLLWSAYVRQRTEQLRRRQSARVAEWLATGAFARDLKIERGPVVAKIDGDRIIINQESRIV